MAATDPRSLLEAVLRDAREALWNCAVTAAVVGNYRAERICDMRMMPSYKVASGASVGGSVT